MMTIHEIAIPLQPTITVTGSHAGQPVSIPEELWQAIEVWRHIKDDSESDRVAVELQRKVNELWYPTL